MLMHSGFNSSLDIKEVTFGGQVSSSLGEGRSLVTTLLHPAYSL